jgi:hypothetical protein
MNENFLAIKPGCKFTLSVMHLRNHSLYANLEKKRDMICISLVWEVNGC